LNKHHFLLLLLLLLHLLGSLVDTAAIALSLVLFGVSLLWRRNVPGVRQTNEGFYGIGRWNRVSTNFQSTDFFFEL
jgi:hypothetical protein